jgi:hypothetical protein
MCETNIVALHDQIPQQKRISPTDHPSFLRFSRRHSRSTRRGFVHHHRNTFIFVAKKKASVSLSFSFHHHFIFKSTLIIKGEEREPCC